MLHKSKRWITRSGEDIHSLGDPVVVPLMRNLSHIPDDVNNSRFGSLRAEQLLRLSHSMQVMAHPAVPGAELPEQSIDPQVDILMLIAEDDLTVHAMLLELRHRTPIKHESRQKEWRLLSLGLVFVMPSRLRRLN